MYCSSSQLKKWTFRNEEELAEFRRNQRKRKTRQATPDELTEEEEATILRQYSLQLREFCRRFQPPMPRRVAATAFHYLNRFYLRNSPQLFHPKEILATCAYLACKVDEFNVSIGNHHRYRYL